jgi:hypothetical protein
MLTLVLKVNACDPQNFEPNLALNLEIADLINSKKGNAYVNSEDLTCFQTI